MVKFSFFSERYPDVVVLNSGLAVCFPDFLCFQKKFLDSFIKASALSQFLRCLST